MKVLWTCTIFGFCSSSRAAKARRESVAQIVCGISASRWRPEYSLISWLLRQ